MRPHYKDKASLEEMEFPAEYMFKNVPDVVPPSGPVDAPGGAVVVRARQIGGVLASHLPPRAS